MMMIMMMMMMMPSKVGATYVVNASFDVKRRSEMSQLLLPETWESANCAPPALTEELSASV